MRGLVKPENTGHSTTARELRSSLKFSVRGHFHKHIVFTDEGEKMRNKEIKDYINVSVVVDIEWGDTRNED